MTPIILKGKGPYGPERPCVVCGALFRPHRKRPDAKYCSKRCIWLISKGPEYNARIARETVIARANAQRGRGEGKTYRKFMGRHEHRVIAERKLGRPLASGEIVHHADEDKQNNADGNLEVLASQSEHARLHFTGKKQSPEHIRKRMESSHRTKAARRGLHEISNSR